MRMAPYVRSRVQAYLTGCNGLCPIGLKSCCVKFQVQFTLILFVCVSTCIPMCTMYMHGAHRGQKNLSDSPEDGVTRDCERLYHCWQKHTASTLNQSHLFSPYIRLQTSLCQTVSSHVEGEMEKAQILFNHLVGPYLPAPLNSSHVIHCPDTINTLTLPVLSSYYLELLRVFT